MKKTYLNIYKKYLPCILIILILMMLSGIFLRKKIYNRDYSQLKENIIIIDEDKSELSNLVIKVASHKNKVIKAKNEMDAFTYLQKGKAKAVYIIQKDFEKEFFETASKDSKVIKKVIEHYGLSREKTAGLSVLNIGNSFDTFHIDFEDYAKNYSKDEEGKKAFLSKLEKDIYERQQKDPEGLNLEFVNFNKTKILLDENKNHIIGLLIGLVILVVISSKPRMQLFSKKQVQFRKELKLYNKENEKQMLKNILPIDILLLSIYTIFTVMVAWLSNMNALTSMGMLDILGIYIITAVSVYLITFLFHATNKETRI